MQRLSLGLAVAGIAFAGLCATMAPATSADLPHPVYKAQPQPAPAPAINWTGFYVGGCAAYGSFRHDSHLAFEAATPLVGAQRNKGNGWFGTGIVGADLQFADRWVAGLFADYDWTDMDGSFQLPFFSSDSTLKLKSAWAVGGRLGYLAAPTVLLYATGGYSSATFDPTTVSLTDVVEPFTIAKRTFNGWFVGGGIETQLFANWSARIEYRYADYGVENATLDGTIELLPYTFTQVPNVRTVRVGLNYRFNAPVVVK